MNSSWLKNLTLAERLWQVALGLGTMLFTFVFVYLFFVVYPILSGAAEPTEIKPWQAGVFLFLVLLSAISMLGYAWAAWAIGYLSVLLGLFLAWATLGNPYIYGSDRTIGLGISAALFTPLVVLLILRHSRRSQIQWPSPVHSLSTHP